MNDRSGVLGFTLIELLLVMGIIALVIGIAAPNLHASVERHRLSDNTREFASALRHLRGIAMRDRRETEMRIDVDAKRYHSTDMARVGRFPAWAELDLLTAASEQTDNQVAGIRFYPDGSSSGGRLRVTGESRGSMTVDVNWLTGTVSTVADPA